jgi:aspartyl-tRNA(Asn)/glutamyl-tRNA(Gln) amidotransferase subunit A
MRAFSKPTDTLSRASERLRAGESTSHALLDQCLAAIDAREAEVRAWVFVNREEARKQAEICDAEIEAGQHRGPLHGIPIAIKDIIDVARWPTAAGFEPWKNRIATEDATIVKRLRDAGAVFIGKTVTTQFASFDPPVTRNPWNLEHTPGGSSSGSAAAVACGMVYAALASQTGGSITRPASYCGVAGFKPTFQRIPKDGVFPLAPSMDHPGAVAATVQDLALVFDVIGGYKLESPPTGYEPIGIITYDGPAPRLARLRGLFEELAEPIVRESMDLAVLALQRAGATIVEVELPASSCDVLRSHRLLMAVEAAALHEVRLRQQPGEYLPWIRSLLEEGLAARAVDYRRAKEHQAELSQAMQDCFYYQVAGRAGPQRVDALLAPATTGPAPPRETTGDPAFNSPWSFTGLPVVSFPVAWTDASLPLAVQLIGRPFEEKRLFEVAHWCESVLQV